MVHILPLQKIAVLGASVKRILRHLAQRERYTLRRTVKQEDLVEEARKSEFKNRLLKAEVEMLRSDLNGLMDIVGLHAHCLDSRLTLYVQREADRLATGNMTSPPFPLPGNILQDTTSIYEQ
jgi:DNA polymerase III delta prime subunit